MILHFPHASFLIPEHLRNQILLSDNELTEELLIMTDWFVDELFKFPWAAVVHFPISRLLVDVERFLEDTEEPISRVGMGVIYTSTAHGRQLKRALLPEERRMMLSCYYEPHHYELEMEVTKELANSGEALIVDCRSFPSHPLRCDADQRIPRPDFCIGKDFFYTPDSLVARAKQALMEMGYLPLVNRPYSGTIVPAAFIEDSRVSSIMIEVNRSTQSQPRMP